MKVFSAQHETGMGAFNITCSDICLKSVDATHSHHLCFHPIVASAVYGDEIIALRVRIEFIVICISKISAASEMTFPGFYVMPLAMS